METWIDLFWFALINVFVFGFISSYLTKNVGEANFLIVGIVMWETVVVGQYTVTVGMLWEIWSHSFSNIFVSPLTFWEFVWGQALSGLVKAGVVIAGALLIANLVFKYNFFSLGWPLIFYFSILFIFAVAAGIFVNSLIFRFGTDIQSLAWGLIYLLQPISAIFYPVSVLPPAIRPVAYLSPVTYIMESIRSQMTVDVVLWNNVGTALGLSIFYLGLSIWIAKRALVRAKETGAFARMGG